MEKGRDVVPAGKKKALAAGGPGGRRGRPQSGKQNRAAACLPDGVDVGFRNGLHSVFSKTGKNTNDRMHGKTSFFY